MMPVFAACRRYRPDLLSAGIRLFELRAEETDTLPDAAEFGILGASASSLHAKTFAVDRQRIFIGSFNFDPRSARLNTEMGLLVESPTIAAGLSDIMENVAPIAAYSVRLDAEDHITWVATEPDGAETVFTTEPGTTAFQRWLAWFVGLLPIQWML